jgi:hypothetical protein
VRILAGEPGTAHCYVLLDGKLVADCVEADEEGGWLEAYVRGPDGRPYVERDEVAKERRLGKVVVTFTEAGWRERGAFTEAGWRPGVQQVVAWYCETCKVLWSGGPMHPCKDGIQEARRFGHWVEGG